MPRAPELPTTATFLLESMSGGALKAKSNMLSRGIVPSEFLSSQLGMG